MIPLALEFMIPNRLWALAIIPVIAVLYVVLSGRTVHRPMSSRLRLVVPRDAAWKRLRARAKKHGVQVSASDWRDLGR